MIPSAWTAKPRVVQYLSLIWALLALQTLISAWALVALGQNWAGLGVGIACFSASALLCRGHFQSSKAAWGLGVFVSFYGGLTLGLLSPHALQSLASFLRWGRVARTDPTLNYVPNINLPFLLLSYCGITSGFALLLAAFVLALSRPARIAYGITKSQI